MRVAAEAGAAGLARAMREAAAIVEATLDLLLPEADGPERRLDSAMRYATLGGGKRLRAFLVMQSAALFDVAYTRSSRVAAAVEMVHAYSLVHDDLPAMDDDDLRRGKPSTHRAFDEATAILAGDALQARAFEIMAEPDGSPEAEADARVGAELVAAFAGAIGGRGMVGGQMVDMLAEGLALGAAEITRLQALKTGRLIQFSAEAGAILGRAAPAERRALVSYGRDLGAAFQIADDLLDAEASTEDMGKTAGKDAAAGKATLVAILGTARARQRALAFADEAVAHLDRFGERAASLRSLARYVVARRN
ncbi:MAG: polyprenyl synthetase family protein [Acetobacteraceae bacterium]